VSGNQQVYESEQNSQDEENIVGFTVDGHEQRNEHFAENSVDLSTTMPENRKNSYENVDCEQD